MKLILIISILLISGCSAAPKIQVNTTVDDIPITQVLFYRDNSLAMSHCKVSVWMNDVLVIRLKRNTDKIVNLNYGEYIIKADYSGPLCVSARHTTYLNVIESSLPYRLRITTSPTSGRLNFERF